MTEQLGKYMVTVELGNGSRKTKLWDVVNKNHSDKLGQIKWYNGWRRYIFEPEPCTVFSSDCMRSIAGFVDKQNQLHKEQIRAEHGAEHDEG